tara:strand:+ start:189 stop:404 length:216 start_codon:yes stop_codon:yes gene_type:complete
MNYRTFEYDLNNVVEYSIHKYLFDQIVYAFNDKYRLLNYESFNKYYNNYIQINNNNTMVLKIIEDNIQRNR